MAGLELDHVGAPNDGRRFCHPLILTSTNIRQKNLSFLICLFFSFMLVLIALRLFHRQLTWSSTCIHSGVTMGREAIGTDAPGSTFWKGGIFGHQCPENVDLHIKSFSCC